MDARYAFRVRVRLQPDETGVTVDPATVETTCTLKAVDPGEDGWLFFRDTLWRGQIADEEYGRRLFSETLDLEVESVEFAALHTDEEYLEALKTEIAADLEPFRAETVSEVISKYFGSSVMVEES